MNFSPANGIVKLCLQSMESEAKGKVEEATSIALQAWNEATNDFEKFLAAHFLARYEKSIPEKLKWLETALQYASNVDDDTVKSAFPSLYSKIASCYEDLGDVDNAKKNYELSISFRDKIF